MTVYIVKEISYSASGDRAIISLESESEQALITVPPEVARKHGVKKGEEISRELFETLSDNAELDEAIRKGLSILGYGSNSAARLEEKLRRQGFSSETATSAVAELIERGYINEEKDALRLCDSLILKKYGPRRVIVALKKRGYDRAVLQKAEEFLSDVDFSEVCESFIRAKIKKLPENREETKKLVAKLTALGYNVSDIRRALERI